MSLLIHDEFVQGSEAWLEARRGMMTASTVGQLITAKTARPANNDTSRALTMSLIAERLAGFCDDIYVSRDMERGTLDEPYARDIYAANYAPVDTCGFMVEDKWGFQIGYSPDGLVGDTGLIEIKSRKPKVQLQTILNDQVPPANMAQLQCGLLVSGREWIDYVSYCSGMPLYVKRVLPDEQWQTTIVAVTAAFEDTARVLTAAYETATKNMPPTERIDHFPELGIY